MKKDFFENSFYSLGTRVVNLILNIGGMAILARLLTPNDFGIFAIILGVQALFQPVLDMGLGPAYIKKEIIEDNFKNSFFTINLLLGALNILFLFTSIFILTMMFDAENFSAIIIVFSLSILFTSLSLIMSFKFTREKDFKTMFIVNTFASIISLIVSISLAYFDFGVWSLVLKAVVCSFVTFLMYIIFSKGFKYKIVSLNIIKTYISDLKFGLSIFINRIVNGMFNSFDALILGKFYNTTTLGNYNNAKQLSMMPDTLLRTSLTSVVYSYLERMDERERRGNYLKYYGLVFLVSAIIPVILFFWGNKIVLLLLGNQWQDASKYIQILSFFSLGMVIRGIIIVISMHEKQIKILNWYNILTSGFIIIVVFILSVKNSNINQILYFISFSILGSWGLFLIKLPRIINEAKNI